MEKNKMRRLSIIFTSIVGSILLVVAAIVLILRFSHRDTPDLAPSVQVIAEARVPDYVNEQILPVSSNSRRNVPLEDLTAIVVHYVGNPGTSAEQNRKYYGNADTTVNSHFLIGLDGEVIQCLPLYEKSSASNDRNRDTISIEVCHPDESGKFTEASYNRLVELCTWICRECGFSSKNIIRHYDITGKACPLYFVENEDAWTQFLYDVECALNSENEK